VELQSRRGKAKPLLLVIRQRRLTLGNGIWRSGLPSSGGPHHSFSRFFVLCCCFDRGAFWLLGSWLLGSWLPAAFQSPGQAPVILVPSFSALSRRGLAESLVRIGRLGVSRVARLGCHPPPLVAANARCAQAAQARAASDVTPTLLPQSPRFHRVHARSSSEDR
jgi:hypothetical protein